MMKKSDVYRSNEHRGEFVRSDTSWQHPPTGPAINHQLNAGFQFISCRLSIHTYANLQVRSEISLQNKKKCTKANSDVVKCGSYRVDIAYIVVIKVHLYSLILHRGRLKEGEVQKLINHTSVCSAIVRHCAFLFYSVETYLMLIIYIFLIREQWPKYSELSYCVRPSPSLGQEEPRTPLGRTNSNIISFALFTTGRH